MDLNKKKIVIIGAGIAGLSAGIYALDNNFDVTIYEKHSIAGGQCTSWKRNGSFIDGCTHWIVGTSKNSPFYPMWNHVGAFDSNTTIFETEYFSKFDINGDIFTFYADLEKLEAEFNRVAPEDRKQTRRFIRGIKAYMHVDVPVSKPLDCYNIFEFMKMGFKMAPMAFHYVYYRHLSIEEYALKFKSPIIREVFKRIMSGKYNIHSLVYTMQTLAKKDAGVIEGGSLRFANNIKNTYLSRGGKLVTSKEVDKIIVENNVAKGIILKDGSKIFADYIVSANDLHHTLFDLLDNKYTPKDDNRRYENSNDYPLNGGFLLSYKISKHMDRFPKMLSIPIKPVELAGNIVEEITIRNHYFDRSICKDSATITILLSANDNTFDYLSSLDKEAYQKLKLDFADIVKENIIKYFNLDDKDISYLDMTTPLTYNRYTNAYKGSYMSFITTKNAKGLMRKGLVKGVDNLVLAGQWLMSPGGLPIALFSGKHAIYRICQMEKRAFINLEESEKKEIVPSLS